MKINDANILVMTLKIQDNGQSLLQAFALALLDRENKKSFKHKCKTQF